MGQIGLKLKFKQQSTWTRLFPVALIKNKSRPSEMCPWNTSSWLEKYIIVIIKQFVQIVSEGLGTNSCSVTVTHLP